MAVATHCFTSPCHDRIRFFSSDDGIGRLGITRKRINGTFLLKILPPIQSADLRTTGGRSSRPLSAFRSGFSKVINHTSLVFQYKIWYFDDLIAFDHVRGYLTLCHYHQRMS